MSTNYEKFIAANSALIACMKAVPVEDFKAMSAADQANVCKTETTTVKSMLESGNISFGAILSERIASLDS